MKNLLIFLGGVAVGAVGSMLYVQKFLLPELRKEVEKEQSEEIPVPTEYRYDISEDAKEEVVSELSKVTTEAMKEAVKENRENRDKQYLDYTKFSGPEMTVTLTTEEKKPEKAMDISENTDEHTEPYIIDEDSFDEYSGYRAITFEIYSDGVILDDETEEELDADPVLTFGKTAMDALEKSPDGVICVRDDSKKCDYRLERKDYPADGPIDVLPPGQEIDWGD